MLVLDLDDTLLRDDHSISIHTKELLTKAQELGVKVVLASGRPTPAMIRYASELQLAQYDFLSDLVQWCCSNFIEKQ